MLRAFSIMVLMALSAMALAIDGEPPLADPSQDARYRELIKEVRCLVCQNQAISDSNAPLAQDLRREIRQKIEAGAGNPEIITFLTDRYGDFVLYRPPFKPTTYLLWAAPILFLLIAGVALIRTVKRRSEQDYGVDGEAHG